MSYKRLEIIDQVSDLVPVLDFWKAHAPTPMQSPEWQLAWWSAYGSLGMRLCVVVVRADDGQIAGLAPFYVRNNWTEGRTIRFLGSGRACGDFQTLLSAPGQANVVGEAIADWLLAEHSELNWSLLELEGVTENDPAIDALINKLRYGRCVEHLSELEHTWRLDLTGGWNGFLDGLSKTQRRQTRNLVNRFDKSNALSLRFAHDQDQIPSALSACIDLHQRRWQADGKPGCFSDTRFQLFTQQACDDMSRQQRISIALLEDVGTPIACHLYLQDAAGNKYLYQSGRDPEREAEGIGRILNAIAVRAACAAGVPFIDLLRGDEMYKGRLGAVPTRCLRRRIVAPAWLPRLRHTLRTISRDVKHQVESMRQRWSAPAATRLSTEQSSPTIDVDNLAADELESVRQA